MNWLNLEQTLMEIGFRAVKRLTQYVAACLIRAADFSAYATVQAKNKVKNSVAKSTFVRGRK
jgi:hypothetical protein